jgi:hypothetical protein
MSLFPVSDLGSDFGGGEERLSAFPGVLYLVPIFDVE